MAGTPQRYGSFYFLPENYNMARNDLLVLSYVWYKWKRKKKRLYSKTRDQFFDFAGGQEQLDMLLYQIPDMEEVEVEIPTWKLAVVLNDQLVFQGDNPLGFDDCPFVPVFWNYEPHNNYYDLRVRGLVRTMRDSNYLLNRRIIINHDISESTIQSGWMRKSGAVANEDNMKKTGQGWDVIINEGYELTDCQKIQPTPVPESNFALADQLKELIKGVSGVDLENWAAQEDKQISSLTAMIKQAANLTVLQKYFDQWDQSLKTLGERLLQVIQNNWNGPKVQLMLGEEPSPFFFSRVFSKCQCLVEEGLLTPTQRNVQAQQMLEINQIFGREVFPPSLVIKDMNMAGKQEALEFLQEQEQQQSVAQQHQQQVASAFEEARLKELYAKAANEIAAARERASRSDSNVGLFEERLAEVQKNEALSIQAKMDAIAKMVEVIAKFGEVETMLAQNKIENYDYREEIEADIEKNEARQKSAANKFVAELLGGVGAQNMGLSMAAPEINEEGENDQF